MRNIELPNENLIEKIENGLKQSEDNDVISEEELNAEVETWLNQSD
jgi:hypothetical protein